MATPKEYAYYLKGNKVAIVEKETSFNNDPNSRDYGPGIEGRQWKSPLSAVTNGLQIEYTYAPTYTINTTFQLDTDLFKFIGWGSDGTNLLLFTYGYNAVTHLPLNSAFPADTWINIKSGRWAGLHQVKSTGGTNGILTLKTLCNTEPNKITVTGAFAASDDSFTDAAVNAVDEFKDRTASLATKYVYIVDSADTANNDGFFKITHSETAGKIIFTDKQFLNSDRDYTESASAIADEASDEVSIYNVFYQQMDVRKNITVMEDESFELDVPNYLAKAIVFYLKAKMFEEMMELEGHEYYMAKFKRQLEKDASNRSGKHKQVQGFWGLR